MTASQRAQYLYGRSVVDLVERPEERGGTYVADVSSVDLPTGVSHADLRQAEYYQGMLDHLRAEVEAALAHHNASLAVREADGDAPRAKRSQRIIRVKEAELAEIDRLANAISSRFPTWPSDDVGRDSSRAHQIQCGVVATEESRI